VILLEMIPLLEKLYYMQLLSRINYNWPHANDNSSDNDTDENEPDWVHIF
jgi:hypothetical protein